MRLSDLWLTTVPVYQNHDQYHLHRFGDEAFHAVAALPGGYAPVLEDKPDSHQYAG